MALSSVDKLMTSGKWPARLLADGCADDLLFFNGAVAGAFLDAFEFFHDVHAFSDFAEDGVVHVEPWGGCGGDEELAAVGAGAGVGHGEKSWLIKFDIAGAFVFEVFAPDGFAAAPGSGRVAALDHELLNDAVKDHVVVIAALAVGGEVFAGLWRDVVKEIECDRTLSGFECYFHLFVCL